MPLIKARSQLNLYSKTTQGVWRVRHMAAFSGYTNKNTSLGLRDGRPPQKGEHAGEEQSQQAKADK